MAEQADVIKDIFVTNVFNEVGIYLLKIWINGVETPVIIDDYVPVSKVNSGGPCFAGNKSGDLWVCLLEKAWAKISGGFAATEGG